MGRIKTRRLSLAATLLLLGQSLGQDKGAWRPLSSTATAITGDIAIANEKLAISMNVFPMAHLRALTPAEINAVFGEEGGAGGAGNLYKVSIAADKKFLRKNTLCGAEETQYMVTALTGKTLHVAFFSGGKMPVLTVEAVLNSTDLCGTYSYVR